MIGKKVTLKSFAGAFSALVLSFTFVGGASAATTTVQCEDLPSAIASATAGDTINVTGGCTITTNTTIDKQLTIQGVDGATISTSGTTQLFTITGDGTTIQDINFVKTDKTGTHNIIGVQADDVRIANNTFTGQYVLGDAEVARALVVSPGVKDVTITGNSFESVRQPAYIDGTATGTITDNYVNETRGFVVEAHTDLTFTGNSWGNNAVDIAIIPGTPNNYSCEDVRQIVLTNNNANVEHQAQTEECATYPVTKEDCKNGGYKSFTIQKFKNQGDCVSYVASGGKAKGNPSFIDSLVNLFA